MTMASSPRDNSELQPEFALQRIYIKDLSFESPKAPGIFKTRWQPEVKLDLNSSHSALDQKDFYEVVLALTVTVTNQGETAFVLELQQACIVMVNHLDEADLKRTLEAFCPNLLFPYARDCIDNIVVRGTFPALMLAPINFDALFVQAQKRMARPQSQSG